MDGLRLTHSLATFAIRLPVTFVMHVNEEVPGSGTLAASQATGFGLLCGHADGTRRAGRRQRREPKRAKQLDTAQNVQMVVSAHSCRCLCCCSCSCYSCSCSCCSRSYCCSCYSCSCCRCTLANVVVERLLSVCTFS
ncbi:PREDICTED: uncharacterized protein LOC108620139 [Drosophila arizonae]|uniref:Uncharacterized protein LOC108620139 n=1 Tax=Drosophila arizonae TaxID=7263 RepID=A0ABM1PZ78_DROAR|nr:PREDICTED: uncharacterized protein LOC108620139 [Drosophila arizonae]